MFERFTDRARHVMVLAQEEARMLNHDYIGTEHLLLGLLREGEGVAAKALQALGVGLEAARGQVEEIVGRGTDAGPGHVRFTTRAKKVLELSLREALQLGHDYIGTEHILLGLLREGEGVAVQVLVRLGADLNLVRQQTVQVLHGRREGEATAAQARQPAPGEGMPQPGAVPREFWLTEIQNALAKIAERLTVIERHLGITDPPADRCGPPGGEEGGGLEAGGVEAGGE